jgi:hypothetical protein
MNSFEDLIFEKITDNWEFIGLVSLFLILRLVTFFKKKRKRKKIREYYE